MKNKIPPELALPARHRTIIPKEDLLSSGCTLLNLNCTGRTDGAFAKGLYYHLVGDSSSGKTFFALTCLAEAAINPNFNGHRLIYDPTENGNLFDPAKFWPVLSGKVEPPAGSEENPITSITTQDFFDHAVTNFRKGPCIYVLDSEDVLIPGDDLARLEKDRAGRRTARKKGKEPPKAAGSYGMQKAKDNSSGMREVTNALRQHGSILLVVSQTRDKLQAFPGFGDNKTYSGGHALRFYATLQMWTSVHSHITKKVREKDREMGIVARVRIKKNRQVGKDRSCFVRFFHSFGIDDVGTNIEYLVEEGHWTAESKAKVKAPEFDFSGKREDLATTISQDEPSAVRLRKLVKKVWTGIEDQCVVDRKNRYAVE